MPLAAPLLILGVMAGCAGPRHGSVDPSSGGIRPTLAVRLDASPADGSPARFEVQGLSAAELADLAEADWDTDHWQALFALYVAGPQRDTGDLPAVLGAYEVNADALRFTPRFPLSPGLTYRAVLNPSRLTAAGSSATRRPVIATFTLPKPAITTRTAVQQVYPTSGRLPENQLRFYIHFSGPMRQGDAYGFIHLVNDAGAEVEGAFLEVGQELWDPSGTRLTLLIEPGRIKRGLKPREMLGPVLEQGRRYTLVIDAEWRDANDLPLERSFRKTFTVAAPDETSPDPASWNLVPPKAGSVAPLTVTFPEPLDHAMLNRVLVIRDAQGELVAGRIAVTAHETRWQFTPQQPWPAGRFQLEVATTLEDLAANSIERPFEVDVFRAIRSSIEVKTVALPFDVGPPITAD